MSKLKLIVVVMGIFILVACSGLIFFANKSQGLTRELKNLSKKLEAISPGYQKLTQAESVLKNENANLLKENEAIKADRENLMTQIKTLLQDRSKAAELTVSLEQLNNDLAALTQEKQQSQDAQLKQKEEVNRLRAAQKELISKWDILKTTCEKSESMARLNELNKKLGDLQKEKNTLQNAAKRRELVVDQIREQKNKLEDEDTLLKSQLVDLRRDLAEAQKKNKGMLAEMQNIPKKFAELARQNKLLIAETAQMHYNLGIFYTKNKQYDRAAIEFEKVVEINPHNAYAHFNLGYIYAEYLVNRSKANKHFRHYLGLAKSDDKDVDWVKKYLLTWEAYSGRGKIQ